MSDLHRAKVRCRSLVERILSNSRVREAISKPKKAFGNAIGTFAAANKVTKKNAKDTAKEMGKMFKANEAKTAFMYTKRLACQTNKELIMPKLNVARRRINNMLGPQLKPIKGIQRIEIEFYDLKDDDDEDDSYYSYYKK